MQVNEKHYSEEIQKLVDGVIDEIIIEKENFLTFRNAWLINENKNLIVGEAGLSGQVVYRLVNVNK